jgi:hypothetical protein
MWYYALTFRTHRMRRPPDPAALALSINRIAIGGGGGGRRYRRNGY